MKRIVLTLVAFVAICSGDRASAQTTLNRLAERGFSFKGAAYQDIKQGRADTCWIMASMAALESKGIDLAKRIHYEGNNQYLVKLYNYNRPAARKASEMHVSMVRVFFDGTTTPADPRFDPKNPKSAWTVIMQRAVIQAVHEWDKSQVIDKPHSGGAGDAIAILTGSPYKEIAGRDVHARQVVEAAIATHKTVVFGCADKLNRPQTLVPHHYYGVLGVTAQGLKLYNPWGMEVDVSWNIIKNEGGSFVIR